MKQPAPVEQSVLASEPRPVMQLRNVRKAYTSGVWAVDDVSLDVYDGEILGLLGPSGCGKTTTLRLMAGLERCDAGTITMNGSTLDASTSSGFVPTNRRRVGMVFQSYAIWPHMTVRENVRFGVKLRGNRRNKPKDEVEAAVEQALDRVGMLEYADRKATALSGGQQQRVAVARALAYRPQLLLMDEPFSNLDAHRRESVRAELKLLQRELGIPTVFVTHDQEEALSLADRIAVMDMGKVEQIGPSLELYRRPNSAHVRDFLGRNVIVEGTLETPGDDSGTREVRVGSHTIRATPATSRDAVPDSHTGACLLSIRPESVVVSQVDQLDGADPGPNSFRCQIITTLFMGDHYQAGIELPWGQRALFVLAPDVEWSEGQEIVVGFPKEQVSVWPA